MEQEKKNFIIEVNVKVGAGEYEWRGLRPTNGQVYKFTSEEATRMRKMCYPESTSDRVRIRAI